MQGCAQAALPHIFLHDSLLWLISSIHCFYVTVFYQPFEDRIENTTHELLLQAQICSEDSQQPVILFRGDLESLLIFNNCLISVRIFTAFQQFSQTHCAYFLLQVCQQVMAMHLFAHSGSQNFVFYEKQHC